MEETKKSQKLPLAYNQESERNGQPNKQDQARACVELGTIVQTSSPSPSHDNMPCSNQQTPPIVQWSYTSQNTTEQLHQVSSSTQAPSSGVLNQWQQLLLYQQSFTNQAQQVQAFLQSPSHFWHPHLPASPVLGANVPTIFQTFTPLGTDNAGWQAHPVIAGGTSSSGQPMIPNFCYHVGYAFPGFPGPWAPPPWLVQMHQLQSPYPYCFPGQLGYASATPGMDGCLPSVGHSFQRGIIRTPAKLSQKHQQLWEAQSVENVQLWSVINNLQSEVANYKDRVMKLEEEVSSLKRKVEESSGEVIVVATGQAPKRGKPKRSVASVDALHGSQLSRCRGRGRKPAITKTHSETKSPIFQTIVLKEVENIGKSYRSANLSNSMLSTQQGMQISQTAFNSASGVEVNGEKDMNLKIAHSVLSQPAKVLSNYMDISDNYIGSTGNRNLVWPSDISRQSSFHNGSFIKQDGKITPGWSFANEEDASEELEDAVVGSDKEENEEEMGDDSGSGAEEIDGPKDEGACTLNNVISARPPLNNWSQKF